MLAAGLQGLQVAAVLHAGSAERSKQRSPTLRYLEIAKTWSLKSLMFVSGHKPFACASEPSTPKVGLTYRCHSGCHWGDTLMRPMFLVVCRS